MKVLTFYNLASIERGKESVGQNMWRVKCPTHMIHMVVSDAKIFKKIKREEKY